MELVGQTIWTEWVRSDSRSTNFEVENASVDQEEGGEGAEDKTGESPIPWREEGEEMLILSYGNMMEQRAI